MGGVIITIMCGLAILYIVVESVIAVVRLFRPAAPIAYVPACGSCGYDTRGLTTHRCPECGSDLRVVGQGERRAVRRAVRRRRLDFVSAVIGWAVLGGGTLVFGSGMVPPERLVLYAIVCGALWLTGLILLARSAARNERA